MAEPSEIVGLLAGGGGGVLAVYKLAEWLVTSKLSKADKAEEKADEAREKASHELAAKMGEVLAVVQKMEKELAVMARDISTQAGSVNEVKARIEGISSNYGPRLAALEQGIVELRTMLDSGSRKRR
jgi:hypothetical protein